jgi:carboxymethylenebutenolidase
MRYEGMLAETVALKGHNGDDLVGYYARPLGAGPFPSVVVIHHAPGWDLWTREVCRKIAEQGYAALSPNLYSRLGDGDPDDIAARTRAEGGVHDDQVIGDIEGAMRFLKAQPYASGRVGAIGFCSGGRQAYLAACRISELDAVVDCWGGGVIPGDASQLTDKRPVAAIDLSARISMPICGIFGNEDWSPTADEVDATEKVLKRLGKTYEFHRYDGASHAFFTTDRHFYRPEQAVDGWRKVFAFYEKYLGAPEAVAAQRS